MLLNATSFASLLLASCFVALTATTTSFPGCCSSLLEDLKLIQEGGIYLLEGGQLSLESSELIQDLLVGRAIGCVELHG